VFDFMRLLKV